MQNNFWKKILFIVWFMPLMDAALPQRSESYPRSQSGGDMVGELPSSHAQLPTVENGKSARRTSKPLQLLLALRSMPSRILHALHKGSDR